MAHRVLRLLHALQAAALMALAVTGTLSKIDWINPHIYIYVDVKDRSGGVTTPQGFRAAGVSAGIKARGLDLVAQHPPVGCAD